jgi:asparagine synthase (glutamine-hydrolysing)
MRFFTCVIARDDDGLSPGVLRAYESLPRSHGFPARWEVFQGLAVLVGGHESATTPLVVSDGARVAVGTVRLDNRAELRRWAACSGAAISDLELVLHTIARHGTTFIPQFLGDFAFVIWHPSTRTAIAACDALRIRQLYYSEYHGHCGIASHAEALATTKRYDLQYLAELVAGCTRSPNLTVYAGVHPLPAGTLAEINNGRITTRQFWTARDFEPEHTWTKQEREAVERCRTLLITAVQSHLDDNDTTWAELSGGTDSSSVVSIAQWLAERGMLTKGLAGTITYVQGQGTSADEREYSNAVVNRWRLRNETIVDPPIWRDDRYMPPRTDQPSFSFIFHPKEYRVCEIVREAGGRVLLTGQGSDEIFGGTMLFFADLVARGRVWHAARELAQWAAKGRVSFWELAYRNALLPLLPRGILPRLGGKETRLKPWVSREAARKYDLHNRGLVAATYSGRIGHKYHDAIAGNISAIISTMGIGYAVTTNALDRRYPFLYRPLVEFGLRLPPALSTRPHARKWVLREAMRGIVPDVVRTRVGKGGPAERMAWSLANQRPILEPLVNDPILADLGLVDAAKLRAAFDSAPNRPHSVDEFHSALHGTLAVEAWLQIRAGRWPCGGHSSDIATTELVHFPFT